jgi:4-methyl-5(b-hydroxyethyl)-thiazole monophosphate biosynthesis
MKKVVVLLAEGFEEIEAITSIDYLRRSEADVTVASIPVRGDFTSKVVSGAHGIIVTADVVFDTYLADNENSLPDCVLLPGGMPGAANLGAYNKVLDFIKKMFASHKLVAAICAAPVVVLAKTGILCGKNYTCYPGMEDGLSDYCGNAENMMSLMKDSKLVRSERVVIDGNLITGVGPGGAEEFAMAVAKYLCGDKAYESVKRASIQR